MASQDSELPKWVWIQPFLMSESTRTQRLNNDCRNPGRTVEMQKLRGWLERWRTAMMNQKPAGMTRTLGDVSKATFGDFRHPNSGTWVRVGRTLIHTNDHLTTMLFTLNPPCTHIALDTGSFTTQEPHCNTPLDFNHFLFSIKQGQNHLALSPRITLCPQINYFALWDFAPVL